MKKPFARHLQRVRKSCLSLPDTMEKISHGEPTFFVKKKVFAMFSNNHHSDGHVAVWIPAPPGLQEALIEEAPDIYYVTDHYASYPAVLVRLSRIDTAALQGLLRTSWQFVTAKKPARKRSTRRIR